MTGSHPHQESAELQSRRRRKAPESVDTSSPVEYMTGTPGFQAPEQLSGTHIGVECDVYAFGAVMVVLFSERPVWPNLSPYQMKSTWKVHNLREIILLMCSYSKDCLNS